MRIAIVRPYANVLSEKGYNVQEFGLAKTMVKHGISVDVFCAGKGKEVQFFDYQTIGKAKFRVVRLPYRTVLSYHGIFPGLAKILKQGNYDLVQTQGYEQITSFLVTWFGAKWNIPVVLHQGVYEMNYGRLLKFMMILFHHSLGGFMRRNVTECMAKTEKAKAFLQLKGFCKIKTLPIGLDTNKFRNFKQMSWKQNKRLDPESFILLYVGVIEPRRNVDFLIRLTSELVKRKHPVYLLVAGSGPDERACKQLSAELKMENRVLFLGKLDQNDLPCLYNDSDLFLLASNYEIVGMVLLEALYFKLPIISTKTAGALDIIDENSGKIIDGIDIGEWSAFISSYVENPKRYGFKENLTTNSFERSWAVLGKQYAAFYQNIIHRFGR